MTHIDILQKRKKGHHDRENDDCISNLCFIERLHEYKKIVICTKIPIS